MAHTYLWDFGDGYFSTDMNPTHTYATYGFYTVTLTVDGSYVFSKPNFIKSLTPYTIGAYEYVDGTHSGDYFVTSAGDDYKNRGGQGDPFRTLDKAMLVADAAIQIDGGHYDLYYLGLRAQNVTLNNPLYIYTPSLDHVLLYVTLQSADILSGHVDLPSIINLEDTSNVALTVVGGFAQEYGQDFIIDQNDYYNNPSLKWKDLALDGLLETGDILRIHFKEGLQRKLTNFMLHGHYSNIEKEKAIFVSPNGSDSTVMGGDGTNTGGNGSVERPFRTITAALNQAASGDYLVAMAGEYPIFNGQDDKSLAIGIDRTSVPEAVPRQYVQDLFDPMDFRAYGTVFTTNPVSWDFNYSGDSTVVEGGGFLNFIYDGSNTASAVATYQFQNDFEITATLINAVDPLKLSVINTDNTAVFICDATNYIAGVNAFLRSGHVNRDMTPVSRYVTEHVLVNNNDIRNKCVSLKYIPEADCSNVSVNIVGGTSQNIGEDFYLNDSKIKWDDMALDGEIQAGDIIRAIYLDSHISNPLKVKISLKGNKFTFKYFEDGWQIAMIKNITGYSTPWSVAFMMDTANPLSHKCLYGRGYASEFTVIADEFYNTDLNKTYTANTERKTLAIFQDVPLAITPDSTLMQGIAGQMYYAHFDATGGSSYLGYPNTWSWNVSGTAPVGLTFFDRTSYGFMDGTSTTAGDYTFSVTVTDPGSREGSATKDFFARIV